MDKDDNIYIVDTNNKRLVQLSREGKFMKEIAPAGNKQLHKLNYYQCDDVFVLFMFAAIHKVRSQ